MKKLFLLALIFGVLFMFAACNTSEGGGDDDDDDAVEVIIEPDNIYIVGSSDTYPGFEIDLSGNKLLDISKYASITIDATLYTDEEGETKATTPIGDEKNLAQFKLLKASGGWDTESNIVLPTQYNMEVDGETIKSITSGSGVPGVLLIQANWDKFSDEERVKSVSVRKVTFAPKVSDVKLDHIYGNSTTVSGNKITFTNAAYTNNGNGNNWDGTTAVSSAALYIFDESFFPLEGKTTLTFNFKLEDYNKTGTYQSNTVDLEHQIHIQAAQNTPEKDLFNGTNAQKYITLEDNMDEDGVGTFTVSVPDMIEAAEVTGTDNDHKGPFTLDAVRIVNNGTVYTDGGVTHVRDKNYTLIIESVTIQ